MNLETRQAYSEVNKFLDIIGEELSNKIPIKLREFFKREMDKSYIPTLNANIPIEEWNLKRKTISIIAGLNLQYWCKDEEKKKILIDEYAQNNINYQKELNETYSIDNLFKNKKEQNFIENNIEQKSIIEYEKLSIFNRILKKIKNFRGKIYDFICNKTNNKRF